MSWISDPQAWTALAALTLIEIVLGIDNIIFILISVGRLPEWAQTFNRHDLGNVVVTDTAVLENNSTAD